MLLLEPNAGGITGDVIVDPGGGGLGRGGEGPEQRVGDPDGDGDAGARERRESVGGGGGEADARDGVGEEQALHDLRRRERVGGREAPVHAHRGGRRWRRHGEERQQQEKARCERRQRAAAIGRHCLVFRVALQGQANRWNTSLVLLCCLRMCVSWGSRLAVAKFFFDGSRYFFR